MNTNDWTIGRRLGVGFALIAVTFVVMLALVWHWNAQSARAQDEYTQRVAPLDSAAQALERRILGVGISTRAYLLSPGSEALLRFRASADGAGEGLQRLGALAMDPEDEGLYRTLVPAVRAYLTEASQLVEQAGLGGTNLESRERALTEARGRAATALSRLSDRQNDRTAAAIAAMQDARERSTGGLFIAVLITLSLFLVVAVLTVRTVRAPARELVRIAQSLERGDPQPALDLGERTQARLGGRAPQGEMPRLALSVSSAARAIERREARLRADGEVAVAAGSSLSDSAIAAASLPVICAHVGAEIGVVYALDDDGKTLQPVALHALDESATAVMMGEGIPGQAARSRRTVILRDIPADTPFAVKIGFDQAPPRTVVALPMVAHESLIGVLLVGSLRDIDATAVAFLESASRQLGGGLDNVRTYARIQRLVAEVNEGNQRVQTQNEELQAQNEELQAQSEEIQAQNEEMQAQGEEIQAQNDQLKGQAEQMTQYAASLAESDRRKSEFLGVLAHELRNPMAAISNGLYALSHSGVDSSMRERAEGIIKRQTRVLGRLIDDLLDVTRIGSGKVRLQREPLDLNDVVRDCVNDNRDVAAAANLKVEFSAPAEKLVVMGDRVRLCQIVGNLLDNAAKFSEKGTVTVMLRHAGGRDEAELLVRDNGIGIDPAMLPKLFTPFSQADTSLQRKRSGLGLGLSLVKSLAEMHGGTVEARSHGLGTGAEFTVRFPLARATIAPVVPMIGDAVPGPSPGAAKRPRRVLIIEDNIDAAASLRDALRLLGHAVHVAHDAQEGIDAAREFRPDVVLCDIGLPTMDGYQVAARLRADPHLRSIFLIAVTGYAGPDDQERAARAGFDRHFGKPPNIERLNRLLEDIPLLHA